ncbi:hypothetical protein ABW19_dt0201019 [Dactylella cylindrospora]|nr:hypothetical protein ABW19_dt0201019 [Dactylella cylindrospora]
MSSHTISTQLSDSDLVVTEEGDTRVPHEGTEGEVVMHVVGLTDAVNGESKGPSDESDSDVEREMPDIDSESEDEENLDSQDIEIRRMSKAQQKQTFDKWFAKRAFDIQTNPKRQAEGPQDNELISIRSLLSNTTQTIISDPREYQLELFEKAKNQNTIAVLDTGSGKTLIATLLIRWVLDQEMEERAKGHKPKICVFLVNSVTLVFQQAAVLECNLDAEIGKYCGEMGADLWTREQWQEKTKTDKVFVATADIIFNCLTHSFLSMSDFSLLIFDECHHTKKQHAYARIMREFYEPEPAQNRPRIFGMTASPVDARVDVVKAAQ